jgi:glycosyltransferase involved in cell wall biosynthesis
MVTAGTTVSQGASPTRREPLVTIGIPAYDRPASLERAVRSALAQDHPALEVLVSDDASPDPAVAAVGGALARADQRVRFVAQPRNLGHAGNYQWVLEQAGGDYFMWLSDDDWLDPDYVSRCLAALRDDPSLSLAGGLACYYRDGAPLGSERALSLGSRRPALRVLRYFNRVNMNGSLFSLGRRADLLAVGFPHRPGGDWLLVAALAGRGRMRCLSNVHIHRSATGLGSDPDRLARSFGLCGAAVSHHHLFVAARVWREIRSGDEILPDAAPLPRSLVAAGSAASILVRFTIADLVRSALGAAHAERLERLVSGVLRFADAVRSRNT